MDVASLGFRTDLMVRHLAGSSVIDLGDHIVVRTPTNPTYHWGNFILVGADFGDAPRWLAAFAAAHPDAGHVAIGLDAAQATPELFAGYLTAGLVPDVSEVLAAPRLAAAVFAPGVACRALAGDADWEQALELTIGCHEISATADLLFATTKLRECRELAEAGNGAWFGAFIDSRLRASLGVITDGTELGRYQSVDTHPAFRRRGLARELLATAAGLVLAEFGIERLVIVADPDYHASTLYRSLGFAPVGHQIQLGPSSD